MSLKIRISEPGDRPGLLALIIAYAVEEGLVPSHRHCNSYLDFILTQTVFVAVHDEIIVGAFVVGTFEHHITGIPTAHKIAWYVYPEHRGLVGIKLLRVAEQYTKSISNKLHLSLPSNLKPPRGYTPLEIIYIKDLK